MGLSWGALGVLTSLLSIAQQSNNELVTVGGLLKESPCSKEETESHLKELRDKGILTANGTLNLPSNKFKA